MVPVQGFLFGTYKGEKSLEIALDIVLRFHNEFFEVGVFGIVELDPDAVQLAYSPFV